MSAFRVISYATMAFCLSGCGGNAERGAGMNVQGRLVGKLVFPSNAGEYLRVRIENKSDQIICIPKAYFSASSGDVKMWRDGKRVEQVIFEDGAGNKIPISFYILQKGEFVEIPFSLEAMGSLRGRYRYEINVGYAACSGVRASLAPEKESKFSIDGSSIF